MLYILTTHAYKYNSADWAEKDLFSIFYPPPVLFVLRRKRILTMSMVSLLFRSWLLLAVCLQLAQTEIESGDSEEGSGSSSQSDNVFDADLVFYKHTIVEGYRFLDGIFQMRTVTSLIECLFQCANDVVCMAINYRDDLLQEDMTENCELIQPIQVGLYDELVKDVRYTFYMILQNNLETTNFCSSSPCPYLIDCDSESERCLCTQGYTGQFCEQDPPATCYDVWMNDLNAQSGTYWIKPDREPIYVYCDMETQGGMWTLVYHYTFTSYATFNTNFNAVFPRPGWPASEADIQISSNSPVFGPGAVDYTLWEYIGGNFLIQSNINDWIFCRPRTGSLVTPINGTIECQNIKNITSNCSGFAPKKITWMPCGPRLYAQNSMYVFDGSSTSCWPIHNPCKETWKDNHEKGVENPEGFIFLRP